MDPISTSYTPISEEEIKDESIRREEDSSKNSLSISVLEALRKTIAASGASCFIPKDWSPTQIEQLVHFYREHPDPKIRPLVTPSMQKIAMVHRMALFAPEVAALIPHLEQLAYGSNDSEELSILREAATKKFTEFETQFPLPAAILHDSYFSLLLWDELDKLSAHSPEEMAQYLLKFWEETASISEELRLTSINDPVLSEKILQMPNLKRLVLFSHAHIKTFSPKIPDCFLFPPPALHNNSFFPLIAQLASLESLTIEGVRDPKLPENLKDLKELAELKLNNCHLNQLPSCLHALPNIRSLDLQNNDFISVPRELALLSKRVLVDLRNNPIKLRLPRQLYNMVQEGRLLFDGPDYERLKPM